MNYDVSESKDLTPEDSILLLRWKNSPPESLRTIILVGRLQRFLIARGHTFPLSVDGEYGSHTDRAGQVECDLGRGLSLGPELTAIVRIYRAPEPPPPDPKTYRPKNSAIFTAAYAGAMSGISSKHVSSDYSGVTDIAMAFAQSFDAAWNDAASPSQSEIMTTHRACERAFENLYLSSLEPNWHRFAKELVVSIRKAVSSGSFATDTEKTGDRQ